MLCVTLETHDPFFNLALEEVLLRSRKEEFFILSINNPCVVIGKHQVAHREVSTKYVSENNIPVIRRISGGGTVYHDTGNLNFAFIRYGEEGKQVDFRKYIRPVIDFLVSLGINAKFEGKNDIKVDGLKVSGNAEHVHRNRVLHHGTLLFSSSVERLKNSIRKDKSYYITRAVGSNPAEVMNLNEKLPGLRDINEFSSEMMRYFLGNLPGCEPWVITAEDNADAVALAETRYKTWEWNFAYGPAYSFKNIFRIESGIHDCRLSVSEGLVTQCQIEGSEKMLALGNKLTGRRHMYTDFLIAAGEENIDITREEIFNFF